MKPISDIYSTLSCVLVGRHPELGVLVSAEGFVKTLKKGKRWCNPDFEWRRGNLDSHGYWYIRVRRKNYLVHRLVAETFIPNPDNKPTVDHIDRNPLNSVKSNLRWANQSEQCRNTKTYDNALDLGVRKHEDPKEWGRRYYKQKKARQIA